MEVLSKEMIRQWILPALTFSAHGRPSVVEPAELVEAILYKLKSGCQWRLLPVTAVPRSVYRLFGAGRRLFRRPPACCSTGNRADGEKAARPARTPFWEPL